MNSMMMLSCLFAMIFAAASLGMLNGLGVVVRPSVTCPVYEGSEAGVYSACEVWQDFRSILSFLLGSVLCGLFNRQSPSPDEVDEPEKMQFSACLI